MNQSLNGKLLVVIASLLVSFAQKVFQKQFGFLAAPQIIMLVWQLSLASLLSGFAQRLLPEAHHLFLTALWLCSTALWLCSTALLDGFAQKMFLAALIDRSDWNLCWKKIFSTVSLSGLMVLTYIAWSTHSFYLLYIIGSFINRSCDFKCYFLFYKLHAFLICHCHRREGSRQQRRRFVSALFSYSTRYITSAWILIQRGCIHSCMKYWNALVFDVLQPGLQLEVYDTSRPIGARYLA